MTREEKTDKLRQLIAEKSATADGFMTRDALGSLKNAFKICCQQLAAGKLFRERVGGSAAFAYFSTPALAKAFAQRQQSAVLARAATTINFAPKPPAAPCKAAEIVYPPNYRRTVRMMGLGRYEVPDMPMRRIGQPDFSMSI